MATREEMQKIMDKLNKAKIGGEAGGGRNGFGSDLNLSSHVKFGIPTRIPELDLSLGRPGYPAGRIIEFYGLPMSGKTTAALHALAQCQRMGGLAVLIDTEIAFDADRAAQCGVDVDNLMMLEARDIEEIFEKIDVVTANHPAASGPLLIAVDSITAVQTRFDAAREIKEGGRVGEHARTIRAGLQRLNQQIADNNACVIFINHATALIGKTFGKQSDSAGGNAIKFWSSIRLQFAFVSTINDGAPGEDRTRRGQKSNVEIVKNKVNATGQPVITLELTEEGFDFYNSLWDAYIKIGVLEKINNQTYFFTATDTQMGKKDWRKFIDKFEAKNGQVLGADGWYKHFLTTATNGGYLKPYGQQHGTGTVSEPDTESE